MSDEEEGFQQGQGADFSNEKAANTSTSAGNFDYFEFQTFLGSNKIMKNRK
jgi:hypothetical protein